jgi:hypothetical protein
MILKKYPNFDSFPAVATADGSFIYYDTWEDKRYAIISNAYTLFPTSNPTPQIPMIGN